jgi:tetratricopeptide (TPR) repeat protein
MESNVAQLPVSHKLWAWFETHKQQTFWGAGLALLVGVLIGFVVWHQGEKAAAAGEALSSVTAERVTGTGTRPDLASAYLKVANAYPDSIAGARALLLAAATSFEVGKYPEAQAQFERFRREYRDSPFLGEALLGIAACLDAQGKTDAAIAAYKELIDRRSAENVGPQAKFALARLYEGQNKLDLARNEYADIQRTVPYGSVGEEAAMRLMELNAQHPEAAAVTPVQTNAPFVIEKK